MKQLFLADLHGMTDKEVREHIINSYQTTKEIVGQYKILIAYESVGDWGCDSSSFFLLRRKSDGQLFDNHGSHCSCYGFEGQFGPEENTLEYLKSDKFYMSCGGYDGNSNGNLEAVKAFIKGMRK